MPDHTTTPRLTASTLVGDLITAFPFLIEELGRFNPHYQALQNPAMRAMMASQATLEIAAMRGGITVDALLNFIASAVQRHTGRTLLVDGPMSRGVSPERLEAFRRIMTQLHDDGDIAAAQRRFADLVKVAEPDEIAEMEQHLIREGVPVGDIKHMCDVHLQVVNPSLKKSAFNVPADHPVATFVVENRRLEQIIAELRAIIAPGIPDPVANAASWSAVGSQLDRLAQLDRHYLRKEHQLFSHLERYGFTGPSTVMWAVHDDIRGQLKAVREAHRGGNPGVLGQLLPPLLAAIAGMVQKEESILLPTALQLLSSEDWATIKRGEQEIGYMDGVAAAVSAPREAFAAAPSDAGGELALNVGRLTLEQVNLIMTHLPVELSFVDEHDTVRFYSNQPHKIFARTPDAIGRKVQNCHPPKSVHLVDQILADFRSGQRDVAEFWIPFNERFVHIRYFAVRDEHGAYRGSLEVVQDVSGIRALTGERRLLAEA